MKKLVLFLMVGTLMSACASVSTLQTARVLKKGESQHSIGVGTYNSDDFLGGDDISAPVVEYTYRRGFFENMDFGIKLANFGALVLDGKYNLINGSEFALATGLGVGYMEFTSTVLGTEFKSTLIDIILPVYLSYDLSKQFTLYSAAKFILRDLSSDVNTTNLDSDGSLLAASLGMKWGQEAGVFLEGTLLNSLENDFTGSQFNASYFFQF